MTSEIVMPKDDRIYIRIPFEMGTEIRVKAGRERRKINDLVTEALALYLGRNKKSKSKASPTFRPPAPEPIEPEPPDLTLTPEEEEEWANALAIGE